jgi:hypothetical protein
MKHLIARIRDKILGIDKVAYLIKKESDRKIQLLDFNKRELKAFEVLKPYFPEGFLLETSYSLSFQTIQHILNDILIFKPKVLLEFGSGLSTLILGNFITKNKLETKLISIDDDSSWQEMLKDQGAIADFYCFPLVPYHPFSYNGVGSWFEIPSNHPLFKLQLDLVIVDAPKGVMGKFSRIGFIPFVKDKLSEGAIVYLDDTHRSDENLISEYFLTHVGHQMTARKYHKYTRFSLDQNFDTSPS